MSSDTCVDSEVVGGTSDNQNNVSDCLSLTLLDGVAVSFRGQLIELGRKQIALLAYLALSAQGKVSRDRVVGLLWSEHSADKARRNLRQLWKTLRDSLRNKGFQGLERSNTINLWLDLEKIFVDVKEVLEPHAAMNPPGLLLEQSRIYESLLADLEGIDSEYDNWILLQRHTMQDRLTHQLENALKQCTEDQSRSIATALYKLDQSNEIAARTLMRLHANHSNVSGALRVYKELSTLLDQEYGMDPTTETEELAVEIKQMDSKGDQILVNQGQSETASQHTAFPELIIDSFNTELVPENQRYVVEGFRHDLMASLARFRDWRVIEKLRQKNDDGSGVWQGRRYELRAQIFFHDAVLQLVFTLLDDVNATIVWSDKYVLRMESWLSTQTAIIRKLAVSLNVNLSANRLNAIWQNRDLPAALHDRWLVGQSCIFQWTPDSNARASEIFRTINADAPNFSPAFSGRAQLENTRHLVFPGLRRKALNDQTALRLARRAVQIDPLDSRAHLSMGWSYSLSGRFEEALRYFDSANEINENDPWAIISTAQGYAFCDETDTAKMLVDTANEFNLPLSQLQSGFHVGTKFLCGDYQGAVESAEIAGDIISNVLGWKTSALWHLGRKDEARAEGQRFLKLHKKRWYGTNKTPTDDEIGDWILHCFPIRSVEKWLLFRTGLENAGVSVPHQTRPPHE